MSTQAALQDLDFDLVQEDGVPLESHYHVLQMILFLELVRFRLKELGHDDAFVGADMFVYYSTRQARAVAEEVRQLEIFEKGLRPDKPKKTAFRGPDAFIVKGAAKRERSIWVAWEEDGRLPDLVLELLSPSTADEDYGKKKRIYQDIFKTSEYFLYAPRAETIDGFRLLGNAYQPIAARSSAARSSATRSSATRSIQRSAERRLWSRELEIEFGVWYGRFEDVTDYWLRLFYPDGSLVPTKEERVEQERQKAEKERQRADAAERELASLRARLDDPTGSDT